jgi:hypothetical protein
MIMFQSDNLSMIINIEILVYLYCSETWRNWDAGTARVQRSMFFQNERDRKLESTFLSISM